MINAVSCGGIVIFRGKSSSCTKISKAAMRAGFCQRVLSNREKSSQIRRSGRSVKNPGQRLKS